MAETREPISSGPMCLPSSAPAKHTGPPTRHKKDHSGQVRSKQWAATLSLGKDPVSAFQAITKLTTLEEARATSAVWPQCSTSCQPNSKRVWELSQPISPPVPTMSATSGGALSQSPSQAASRPLTRKPRLSHGTLLESHDVLLGHGQPLSAERLAAAGHTQAAERARAAVARRVMQRASRTSVWSTGAEVVTAGTGHAGSRDLRPFPNKCSCEARDEPRAGRVKDLSHDPWAENGPAGNPQEHSEGRTKRIS